MDHLKDLAGTAFMYHANVEKHLLEGMRVINLLFRR